MIEGCYLQYGCGFNAPDNWLNFDASPTLRFERFPLLGHLYTRNRKRFPANVSYGDIVKGLPVGEASCRAIYCSHILEHLSWEDFHLALRNTNRYLKPCGVFRLVVPDLRQLAQAYLQDEAPLAAAKFMESSYLGKKRRPRDLSGFLKDWIGGSQHLWMWDEKSMFDKLLEHGFTDVRRAHFGDAGDPRFQQVEDIQRFNGCLAVHCVKRG